MDPVYLAVIVLSLILGLGSQALIKLVFKKWNKVQISSQYSGAQIARMMLNAYGLSHIPIQRGGKDLTDHYDPRTRAVTLSAAVYDGTTVAAAAIACHECGHAVQHATKYAPGSIRTAIVPVVNIASNVWIFVLFLGIILVQFQLILVAVILYAAVILFQLVTLPVEFNASKRAIAYITTSGYLPPQEHAGAKSVLRAAAFTYVAAALASLLYLLYILGFARR